MVREPEGKKLCPLGLAIWLVRQLFGVGYLVSRLVPQNSVSFTRNENCIFIKFVMDV